MVEENKVLDNKIFYYLDEKTGKKLWTPNFMVANARSLVHNSHIWYEDLTPKTEKNE